MASRFPLNGNSTSGSPFITGLSGDLSYIQIGMEVSFYTTSDSDGSTLFPGSVTVVSVNTGSSTIVVSEDAMTNEFQLFMAFHSLLESSPTASGTLTADLSVSSPSVVSLDASLDATASINADLVTFTKDFNLLEASLDANASVLADLVTITKDFNLLFAVFTGSGNLTADLNQGSPPVVTFDSLLTAEASCSARTFVCIRYLEANLSGSASLVGGGTGGQSGYEATGTWSPDITGVTFVETGTYNSAPAYTATDAFGAGQDAYLWWDTTAWQITDGSIGAAGTYVAIGSIDVNGQANNIWSALFGFTAVGATDAVQGAAGLYLESTNVPTVSVQLSAALDASADLVADIVVTSILGNTVTLSSVMTSEGVLIADLNTGTYTENALSVLFTANATIVADLEVTPSTVAPSISLEAGLTATGSIWASDLSVYNDSTSIVDLNASLSGTGSIWASDLSVIPSTASSIVSLNSALVANGVLSANLDGGVAVNVLLDANLTGAAVLTADLKQISVSHIPLQASLVTGSTVTAELDVQSATASPEVTLESSLSVDGTCNASLSVVSNIISIVPMAASFAAAAVLTGSLLIDNQLEAEFWGTGEMAPAMVDLQPRPEARLTASGVMSSPAIQNAYTLQPAQFSAVGKITAQLDRGMEGIGVCHVVDDLFRMWGIEKPCATTLSVRERAITDLNAAMQTIWSFSKNVDFWTRTTELVTVPAGIGSILLSNDIQNVLSPCRTEADNRPLAPLHSIDELENFSIYYLGGLTHAQATGTPTSFYVERDNQTGNDPARCTLHLAPTPVVDTTVKLDVIKECPRFSWKDYENCSRIPIPHQYIESILLPITRYRSSNYRLFYDKEGKSAIFEEYQMALGQLGANDPIPTWDKTEQQGDKA